ncbi:MAG: transporter substrate-binding domain-containing protein [Xanthobacteraceae bacterium]|nr:transporter substrate-binding domain-containing protein [Xanthobacteraceae bacterium]
MHDPDAPVGYAALPALRENRGEALIASISVTLDTRKSDFSDPYYRVPARLWRGATTRFTIRCPRSPEGNKVAVVAGSAHEAHLKAFYHRSGSAALSAAQARAGTPCAAGKSIYS